MEKKTYMSPAALAVGLSTCKMMAESLPVDDGSTIDDSGQILTKEDKAVGKSIWDEEW